MANIQTVAERFDKDNKPLCFTCAVQAATKGEKITEKLQSYEIDDSWVYYSTCSRCKDHIR